MKLVAKLQRAEERQSQTKALPALKLGTQFTGYVQITQQLPKDRDTDMQNEIIQVHSPALKPSGTRIP
jgi:hypothetical protein